MDHPVDPRTRLQDFLMLLPPPVSLGDLLRYALRLAAVYKVHCLVRHGHLPQGQPACEALRQAAWEACRGFPETARALQWS